MHLVLCVEKNCSSRSQAASRRPSSMSAILSAADLNDFISPGVACIKPVETLPKQAPSLDPSNPYEVTTEDKLPASEAPPAQISLTDCLACSGCVTSAEAVLVSLQSHNEVLNMLEDHPAVHTVQETQQRIAGDIQENEGEEGRIFIASVSPQTRASIAATYGVTEREAGNMISQLLSGEHGLKSGGRHKSSFTWVVDTNTVRELCQAAVTEEALRAAGLPSLHLTSPSSSSPRLPVLASACPGWICYAEKTHPHVLPHLSALRSPQALSGVLLKTVLSRRFNIPPSRIYHVAIMPCFDKKLEASRAELTDTFWSSDPTTSSSIRDTDTVITARELINLADTRGISFPHLPRTPVTFASFPDPTISSFLFPCHIRSTQSPTAGPSGGYAYTILQQLSLTHSNSTITTTRGRNADVLEYTLLSSSGQPIMRTARYFGFRNIQNLVRRLKPAKKSRMPGASNGRLAGAENRRSALARSRGAAAQADGGNASRDEMGGAVKNVEEYAYVEVMACPGGCTNGGGQIKVDDVGGLLGEKSDGDVVVKKAGPLEQKEWLARVDEAYYSAESDSSDEEEDSTGMNGVQTKCDEYQHDHDDDNISVAELLQHWTTITDISLEKLLFTTYRQVESDVGKEKGASDMERVAGLASSLGGGW